MPKFDFKCPQCETLRPDVWVTNWTSATGRQMPINCQCGAEMEKQPAAPNFTVKGYSARNNYGVKNETK